MIAVFLSEFLSHRLSPSLITLSTFRQLPTSKQESKMTPLNCNVIYDLSKTLLIAAKQDPDSRAIIRATVSEIFGLAG